MKVAAGRNFFELFGEAARASLPDITWALFSPDGSWSADPADSDLIVYAGDAYNNAFVERVIALAAPKWAHTEGAGTDGVFCEAMRMKEAKLTYSPGANAAEVAEMVFAQILWAMKRLGELRDQQRAHLWKTLPLQSLSDKTLLVVGLGSIGARVAALGKAFGMRVVGVRKSLVKADAVEEQGTLEDLPRLLPESDIVVLALPLTSETQGRFDATMLAQFRHDATLVNVGRGALIDIEALKRELRGGRFRHVCLDVLPAEPWPADDDLWDFEKVLITPHNAALSPLYLQRVGRLWLENLRRFLAEEPLLNQIS